ncbi:nucleoside phosphorylase [Catenulispora sp. GAS73]|uniref:5'-methylthioadenosine/S-adenosylhomocysteine nucleosidase family protein n=1 Tax=Catenulispora sp. GAS73 TaxID=3156269 RepID=UPI0035136E77
MDTTNRIVVLTALPVETAAVHALMTQQAQRHDLPQGTIVREAPLPGTEYTVCVTCTGPGNPQAALIAQSVITWANPAAVFFVGVAGSLKSDVAVGDVVAATQVLAYDGGKHTTEGFKARPTAWDSTHGLVQAAQETVSTGSWLAFMPDGADPAPLVHFKPIASGPAVKDVADSWVSDFLDTHYNSAAAIETEGAGAALAAHHTDARLMVIRGISDPADGTKAASDARGSQTRAAQYAAALAFGTITELPAPSGPGPARGQVNAAAPPEPQADLLRWSVLETVPAVSWRAQLQQAYGSEPATLEVHLVPVDADARLEVQRLASLRDELVQLGRDRGLFDQAQGVDADASALATVACVRDLQARVNSGLAVMRTGQRSAWEALPRGEMTPIFDPKHIAARLSALINILLGVSTPIPARIAPVVGLEPAMAVAFGTIGVPQSGAVQISTHMRPVRTTCEDSVSTADLPNAVDQVAQELAARLGEVFRTQRG